MIKTRTGFLLFKAPALLCALLLLIALPMKAQADVTGIELNFSTPVSPEASVTIDVTIDVPGNQPIWCVAFDWASVDGPTETIQEVIGESGDGTYTINTTAPTVPALYDSIETTEYPNADCTSNPGISFLQELAEPMEVGDDDPLAGPEPGALVEPNPDLVPACGMDITLLLDESGSIDTTTGATTAVRTGALAFAEALIDTGSRLAIAEFSGHKRGNKAYPDPKIATTPVPFTVVNQNSFDTIIKPYVNNTNGDGYFPNQDGVNEYYYTDWEAGAIELKQLNDFLADPINNADKPYAPLVLYFTDGDPNRRINIAGDTERSDGAGDAADEAKAVTNQIKLDGSHILVLGVGNALGNNESMNRLKSLSGDDVAFNVGQFDIRTTDVTVIEDFDDMAAALQRIVFSLCAPSLTITKLWDPDGEEALGGGPEVPAPKENWEFTATTTVYSEGGATECTNTDPDVISDEYEWQLPEPPGLAASLGTTRAATTNAAGSVTFQWTPGTVLHPKRCRSRTTFNETYGAPNGTYRYRSIECTRKTFTPDGFVEIDVPVAMEPVTPVDAVVDFGPDDLITCIVINDDENSVPVTLGWFRAVTGVNPGDVEFAWQTATEIGNLGFHLYAEDDKGKWRRINEELIPSQPGDSVTMREYRYRDSGVDGDRYLLGDVDRYGGETRHGPFELGKAHGLDRGGRIKTDWRAIRAEHRGKAEARRQQARAQSALRLQQQLDNKLDSGERRARSEMRR